MLSLFYGPTLTTIHDYWKTIALTRWSFISKVMSLLFNMLSRLVIAFLPRSKRLLISWQHSPSAVILEPPKIKSATVSTVSPPIGLEAMGKGSRGRSIYKISVKGEFNQVVTLQEVFY